MIEAFLNVNIKMVNGVPTLTEAAIHSISGDTLTVDLQQEHWVTVR